MCETGGAQLIDHLGADAAPVGDCERGGDGAGIAVRKEDEDLKQMFNEALAEIIADGTYKTINEKYFPFSIY